MDDLSNFFLINNGFTIVLISALIYGIKGVVVMFYAAAPTAHTFTMELVMMWNLAGSTIIFFGVLVAIMVLEGTNYHHAQNICAYFFFVLAMFFYSIHVTLECTEPNNPVCLFLYPVSKSTLIESSVNTVTIFIHLLTTVSFAIALQWTREIIKPSFTWGGGVFIIAIIVSMQAIHLLSGKNTCEKHPEFVSRASSSFALETLGIAGISLLPFLILQVAAYFDSEILASLAWPLKPHANEEDHDSMVAYLCVIGGYCACAAATFFGYLYGLFKFPICVMLWIVLCLAALGPLNRWSFFGTISKLLSEVTGNPVAATQTRSRYTSSRRGSGRNNPEQLVETLTEPPTLQPPTSSKTHPYPPLAPFYSPTVGYPVSTTRYMYKQA